MNDPAREIASVVYQLAATDSPDIQKGTVEKYMTQDVAFKHPVCEVKSGLNSRQDVLGIYQWYRVLSPHIDIKVDSVAFDSSKDVIYLEIVQWFKLFFLPHIISPAPARLITRIQLRKVDNLYYIAKQEDFYHTDDFAALLLPISVPFVKAALLGASLASNILIQGANFLGYWRPTTHVVESTPSEAGLYEKEE